MLHGAMIFDARGAMKNSPVFDGLIALFKTQTIVGWLIIHQ